MRIDVADVCVAPVSAEAPAGEDARYDPEYTRLLDEIEKLTSVTRGGGILWPQVVESACVVLRTRSKDLQAACYLAVGLAETEGVEGAAAGARLLTDFIHHYWESGFPALKRLRGRINALDWWRERTLAFLHARADGPPLSLALYEGLAADIAALDNALGEACAEYLPLRDMKEAARHLPSEQPVAEAPAQPAAATSSEPSSETSAPAGSTPAGAPSPSSSTSLSSPHSASAAPLAPPPELPGDAGAARGRFLEFTLEYARLGHRLQPADALPWRALRLALWEKVAALPPAEGQTTRIPAPDMERKALWEQRVQGEAEPATLTTLALAMEELVPAAVFWLDLQRLIATALEKAGTEFVQAAVAVRGETTALLRRLPGLAERTFADGTPFADAATREWLGGLLKQGAGAETEAASTPNGKALAEAERLAAGGQHALALAVLDEALRCLSVGRERFAVRVAQLNILCRCGEWLGATALADALLDEATALGLADWDPEALLPVLLAARNAWEGFGGETGTRRALELQRRLFAMRPSALLTR